MKKIFLYIILLASLSLPFAVQADTTSYILNNPFGSGADSPAEVIVNVINFAVGIIGILCLVMFIYGGFVILTAHGNADQFKKGTHTLVYAIIGMIVVLTSYSVLNYIFTEVYDFTTTT